MGETVGLFFKIRVHFVFAVLVFFGWTEQSGVAQQPIAPTSPTHATQQLSNEITTKNPVEGSDADTQSLPNEENAVTASTVERGMKIVKSPQNIKIKIRKSLNCSQTKREPRWSSVTVPTRTKLYCPIRPGMPT